MDFEEQQLFREILERLARIETLHSEGTSQGREFRLDIKQRMTAVEASLATLMKQTSNHVVKAVCVNSAAKVLQGASATGGIVGGIIAILYALRQMGLI